MSNSRTFDLLTAKLRAIFNAIDVNGDGTVDSTELELFLDDFSNPLAKSFVEYSSRCHFDLKDNLFSHFDTNHDGVVDKRVGLLCF